MFGQRVVSPVTSLALLGVLAVACSSARVGKTASQQPVLVFPASFAEGSPDAAGAEKAGGHPDAGPNTTPARSLPDPPATSASKLWEYEITYDQGELKVGRVRPIQLDEASLSPRRMGRYALELRIGDELLERVRFEFPLVEPPKRGIRRPLHEPPQVGPGLVMTKRVRLPHLPRATGARLVDHATGKYQSLPWPPQPAKTTNTGVTEAATIP